MFNINDYVVFTLNEETYTGYVSRLDVTSKDVDICYIKDEKSVV